MSVCKCFHSRISLRKSDFLANSGFFHLLLYTYINLALLVSYTSTLFWTLEFQGHFWKTIEYSLKYIRSIIKISWCISRKPIYNIIWCIRSQNDNWRFAKLHTIINYSINRCFMKRILFALHFTIPVKYISVASPYVYFPCFQVHRSWKCSIP